MIAQIQKPENKPKSKVNALFVQMLDVTMVYTQIASQVALMNAELSRRKMKSEMELSRIKAESARKEAGYASRCAKEYDSNSKKTVK